MAPFWMSSCGVEDQSGVRPMPTHSEPGRSPSMSHQMPSGSSVSIVKASLDHPWISEVSGVSPGAYPTAAKTLDIEAHHRDRRGVLDGWQPSLEAVADR